MHIQRRSRPSSPGLPKGSQPRQLCLRQFQFGLAHLGTGLSAAGTREIQSLACAGMKEIHRLNPIIIIIIIIIRAAAHRILQRSIIPFYNHGYVNGMASKG